MLCFVAKQQRPARRAQHGCRRPDLALVRPDTPNPVQLRLEKALGIVIDLALGVLAQGEEGGAAIGWVQHDGHSLGQRLEDLLRPCDPVPIAGDRAKGVVHRSGRVREMLDLLQHGIGNPAREGVPGEDQDRQPVGMRRRGRRHHVGRPWPDGGGGHHDLPAQPRLGESDRGQRRMTNEEQRAHYL